MFIEKVQGSENNEKKRNPKKHSRKLRLRKCYIQHIFFWVHCCIKKEHQIPLFGKCVIFVHF